MHPMRQYLLFALLPLSLAGCIDKFDTKTHDKLQAKLPPDATVSATGTLLASGRVVGVSDGDTLTVLASDKKSYKIRLQGIDAPEKDQPFGQVCKEALMMQTVNLTVAVEAYKVDRYGRVIAKVTAEGKDAALEQIRNGCGWHYAAYAKEQSNTDQQSYADAEKQARKTRKGLWKDKQPVAPWDFRQKNQQK